MPDDSSSLPAARATLIPPSVALQSSYLHAMADFSIDGRTAAQSALVHNIERFGGSWRTPEGFQAYVRSLEDAADPEAACPDGWVHSSTYWLVTADEGVPDHPDAFAGTATGMDREPAYIGEVRIRHELAPHLVESGGHIGYDIAPAHRQRGYGTLILRLALPLAAALGIEQALLMCDRDNVASRRIIERNGGVFEDERAGLLRFWVPAAIA